MERRQLTNVGATIGMGNGGVPTQSYRACPNRPNDQVPNALAQAELVTAYAHAERDATVST